MGGVAALILGLFAALASASAEESADASALRLKSQALLDAVAPGDRTVWDKTLLAEALLADEEGRVRTKEEFLSALSPLPAGLTGSIKITEYDVVISGDVAVASHIDQESLDYHGQQLASRFRTTETWLRRDGEWRLLGAQVIALQKDPPARAVDARRLCDYAGTYALTDAIMTTASCDKGELIFEREGRPAAAFVSEFDDIFFQPGRPRVRRIFLRNDNGAVTGFADRREGEDIVWKRVETQP